MPLKSIPNRAVFPHTDTVLIQYQNGSASFSHGSIKMEITKYVTGKLTNHQPPPPPLPPISSGDFLAGTDAYQHHKRAGFGDEPVMREQQRQQQQSPHKTTSSTSTTKSNNGISTNHHSHHHHHHYYHHHRHHHHHHPAPPTQNRYILYIKPKHCNNNTYYIVTHSANSFSVFADLGGCRTTSFSGRRSPSPIIRAASDTHDAKTSPPSPSCLLTAMAPQSGY